MRRPSSPCCALQRIRRHCGHTFTAGRSSSMSARTSKRPRRTTRTFPRTSNRSRTGRWIQNLLHRSRTSMAQRLNLRSRRSRLQSTADFKITQVLCRTSRREQVTRRLRRPQQGRRREPVQLSPGQAAADARCVPIDSGHIAAGISKCVRSPKNGRGTKKCGPSRSSLFRNKRRMADV